MTNHIPRKVRIDGLASRAAQAEARKGADAMTCVKIQIDVAFGHAATHNRRKMIVERAIGLGAHSIEMRGYYGKLAMELTDDLDESIRILRTMLWKKKQEPRRQYWPVNLIFSIDQITVAMIALRMLRAKNLSPTWPLLLEALTTPAHIGLAPMTFFVAANFVRPKHVDLREFVP